MEDKSQYTDYNIERIFLVDVSKADDVDFDNSELVMNGFLKNEYHPSNSIKISTKNDKYFMIIRRYQEFEENCEIVIPLDTIIGTKLLLYCTEYRNILIEENIEYKDTVNNLTWIIHRYYDDNDGLILATVRYDMIFNIKNKLVLPKWAIKDVTKDERYKEYNLSLHPYNTWDLSNL